MNTDALLLRSLEAWNPGRYEMIATVGADGLGGGDDFDTRQLSDPPSWLRDNYPDLVKAPDPQLLALLQLSLVSMGGELSVVQRILKAFDDTRQDRSPALLWEPNSKLSKALDATHRLDDVFERVASALDMAVKRAPSAPVTAVRPNLLAQADMPSFPPSFFGLMNSFDPAHSLIAPIGGTQKLFAVLGNYRASGTAGGYECDLYLVVGDDFGVDDKDVTKHIGTKMGLGTPLAGGLAAFWVLQHMRGRNPLINLLVLRRRLKGGGGEPPRVMR